EQFVKEGTNVMLASRNEDELKAVQAELAELNGGNVNWTKCDITKSNEIDHLIERTVEIYGSLDILINNAGGPPSGGFDDMDDEDWQKAFELNLLSYIRIIRES